MSKQDPAFVLTQPPLQSDEGTPNTRDFIQFKDSFGNTVAFIDSNGQLVSYGAVQSAQPLAQPAGLMVTTKGTAGSTTYGYRISAVNGNAETIACTEVTTTTGNATLSATNAVNLNWNPVNGATKYGVYGRTSGAELFMGYVFGDGRTGPYTFTDDGTVTPAGALPAAPTGGKQVVQRWKSQSNNLVEVQDEAGAILSGIDSSGQPIIKMVATTTTPYNVGDDGMVEVDATAAVKSVVLPTPAASNKGRSYTVKKTDVSANAVTLSVTGGTNIDGAATYALSAQWKYVTVRSNGTAWRIVANN